MCINIFAAIIFTASFFPWAINMTEYPRFPCYNKSSEYKYNKFVKNHILHDSFDRNSLDAWKRYLKKEGLWCRTPVQSFISDSEWNVDRICSSDGHRLADSVTYAGNLCISNSEMLIYDVTIRKTNKGRKMNVTRAQRPVIVACDNVGNKCLPVHFQKYEHQTPSDIPCNPARIFSIVVE